jgi:error-prone DNA polymerase
MARLFRCYPQALTETLRFAERLSFSLNEVKHNYPEETTEAGVDPQTELERLTREGAQRRYPEGVPEKVQKLIRHELAIVAEKKYARYFLTVHDIVRYARSDGVGILCQGRGSAANSVICFCLHITEVDPALTDVLFERFVSTERDEPPDIDVDFEHERREEVIQYIYSKYSEKRTALAAAVTSYRGRSALREVAKAMGLSDDIRNALSGSIWGWSTSGVGEKEARAAGIDLADPTTRHVVARVNEIIGFPRHLTQHVGGFVITKDRLDEIVPIVKTGMEARRMVEWDKDDLDAVSILKVDVLALGMLSCLKRAFDLLEDHYHRRDKYGRRLTLATIPPEDENVYAMICRADTLGVPLFQEQAMKIAIDAGGFTAGEADQLRRAMATFRRNGTIELYEKRMVEGMVGNGYTEEFARRCFNQIKGFGDYGFPESHAASFALLVYASSWFKAFYPDVFCAAILNSQPMGFYQPAQLVRDAREHGIEIRDVDINHSVWDCTLEEAGFDPGRIHPRHAEMRETILSRNAVRLGFRQIKGLSGDRMDAFVERRGGGYSTVRDIWLRSGLDVDEIEKLAQADAFRSIGLGRREALWAVKALDRKTAVESLPLFDRPGLDLRDREPKAALPAMPPGEHVIHDYRMLGLSLKAHPISFLRERLDAAGITPSARLPSVPDGRRIWVAGLVLVRQRPGNGKAIFLTLEDEGGIANIIIWERRFARYRPVVMGSRFIRVRGRVQSESGVIHIVAEHIEDLTPWLSELSEGFRALDNLSSADEVKHPASDGHDRRHRRIAALARALPTLERDYEALADEPRKVMPKGRNFQ